MFLQESTQKYILSCLAEITGKPTLLERKAAIAGGSINEAYRFETSSGDFFIKLNSSSTYPGMFEVEEKGLALLESSAAIGIPKVLKTGSAGKTSFFIAKYLEAAPKISDFNEEFAHSLANLHRNTSALFGLDHNNYIGSLQQSNLQCKSWNDFFIYERLEKQLRIAVDNSKTDFFIMRQFEKLYKRLDEIFPSERPSLLHGDLWNQNYLVGPDGKPWLIDPAVYYGFREMDIAMSKLFGGFDEAFYKAYHAEYPMEKGWEKRLDICNLYPLMVHVNLFGGSAYISQVSSILRRF